MRIKEKLSEDVPSDISKVVLQGLKMNLKDIITLKNFFGNKKLVMNVKGKTKDYTCREFGTNKGYVLPSSLSAWEILRIRDEVFEDFKRISVKGSPFKIYLFGGKVWTYRVLVVAIIVAVHVRETIEHLFLSIEVAAYIWNHYAGVDGIRGPWVQVKYTMKIWMNIIIYGGVYNRNKVIWDVNSTICKFISLKPVVYSNIVIWVPPSIGWLKCNTGGASRGNPGLSASVFCLRNHEGKFLGAKGVKIIDSTILVVEPRAISRLNLIHIKMFLVK
ncbi:hypothetical protein H5410_051630, partial [Solanum commersonii]